MNILGFANLISLIIKKSGGKLINLNQIFLLGNLTRDPELKYTNEGTAIAEMSADQYSVTEQFSARLQKNKLINVDFTCF